MTGAWVLAVGAVGYVSGTSSVAGWILLATISVAPPVLMMRLRGSESQSMSESIRNVLR